jgi:hypothetical protein
LQKASPSGNCVDTVGKIELKPMVAIVTLKTSQALVAQKEAQRADKAMYVCLGGLTEQAGKFAKEKGVVLGWVS